MRNIVSVLCGAVGATRRASSGERNHPLRMFSAKVNARWKTRNLAVLIVAHLVSAFPKQS